MLASQPWIESKTISRDGRLSLNTVVTIRDAEEQSLLIS